MLFVGSTSNVGSPSIRFVYEVREGGALLILYFCCFLLGASDTSSPAVLAK